MDNTSFEIKYDESKDLELIYDFHGSQIFRVNTTNTNDFLAAGNQFDTEVIKKVDSLGRLRSIYIADKIPPLTAIMKHVENPYKEVKWGVYAIILPEDLSILSKISPIISYALNITELKNKYAIKLFNHSYRANLKEVIEWQDNHMEIGSEGFIDMDGIG